jgi:type VI secretion system secreted protein Hcp
MAIYMQYGKVTGDVTTGQYKNWIHCHSFQWGVGRGIATAHGATLGRQGSHASVSEVTITKIMDPATLDLMSDIMKGQLDTTVEIDFTYTDTDNASYLKIMLYETGISGFSVSSGGDRPSESLSLNFTKVAVTDIRTSADGKTKTPVTITYDLGLMKLT